MIDHIRLLKLLEPERFQLALFDNSTLEVVYVRRSQERDLFERIIVAQGWERGGHRGDMVSADVECSIVPAKAIWKGMCDNRCLVEIASEPESGWTKIANETAAIEWERKVAAFAPDAVRAFTKERGKAVLDRTEQARKAAARYLDRVPRRKTADEQLADLRGRATNAQAEQCKDFLTRPIIWIPGGEGFYELAALLVIMFSEQVEGQQDWLRRRVPDADKELIWRLQLLASRLAREPGWGGSRSAGAAGEAL